MVQNWQILFSHICSRSASPLSILTEILLAPRRTVSRNQFVQNSLGKKEKEKKLPAKLKKRSEDSDSGTASYERPSRLAVRWEGRSGCAACATLGRYRPSTCSRSASLSTSIPLAVAIEVQTQKVHTNGIFRDPTRTGTHTNSLCYINIILIRDKKLTQSQPQNKKILVPTHDTRYQRTTKCIKPIGPSLDSPLRPRSWSQKRYKCRGWTHTEYFWHPTKMGTHKHFLVFYSYSTINNRRQKSNPEPASKRKLLVPTHDTVPGIKERRNASRQ